MDLKDELGPFTIMLIIECALSPMDYIYLCRQFAVDFTWEYVRKKYEKYYTFMTTYSAFGGHVPDEVLPWDFLYQNDKRKLDNRVYQGMRLIKHTTPEFIAQYYITSGKLKRFDDLKHKNTYFHENGNVSLIHYLTPGGVYPWVSRKRGPAVIEYYPSGRVSRMKWINYNREFPQRKVKRPLPIEIRYADTKKRKITYIEY